MGHDPDGLSPSNATCLLGLRRFRSGAWPLMIGASSNASSHATAALQYNPVQLGKPSYHAMLYAYCGWCLPNQPKTLRSTWSGYTHNRPHYTPETEQKKRQMVQAWVTQIAPPWVVDLGCNTGEYTHIAAQAGASVIAIDADHDSVSQLYDRLTQSKIKTIYPVIANLADLNSGGGWLGQEKSNLLDRIACRADMVLCLGLLHHLIATEGVALNRVVDFLGNLTERTLVIELIAPEDPMAQLLMRQRNRSDSFPNIDQQLDGLRSIFHVEKRENLGPTRDLVLMQKIA